MGFVTINGQTVHTSTLGINTTTTTVTLPGSGSGTIYNNGSGIVNVNTGGSITIGGGGGGSNYGTYTIVPQKTTYHVLGEDVTVDGYKDMMVCTMLSSLNVLGKPFWEEIKKQGISLQYELVVFIEERLKILERDKKIDLIIGESSKKF